jgi:predicted nuclease with TOPRIM domain
MMEKSHLSENYFSLARKHEEMEDRLEEMLKKIEIEEYIARSSLKHVRYRLREQLVKNSKTNTAYSSMTNHTSSPWRQSSPTRILCSQTIS